MIAEIAWFEIRTRMRQLGPWIYFTILFGISCLIFVKMGGISRGTSLAGANSLRLLTNSTFNLYRYISLLNVMTIVVVASMMGKSICRDFQSGTGPLFFTRPITELQYLAGRFTGTFAVLFFISTGAGLGALAAGFFPGVEPEMFGPNTFTAYLRPYLLAVIPNIFISGALFFALGALTRKMLPVYATGVILLIAYSIATEFVTDIDRLMLASLLDPFGFSAEEAVTRYWTVVEKNTRLMPLEAFLVLNRLLWCFIGGLTLLFTWRKFSFSNLEFHSRGEPAEQESRERSSQEDSPAPVREFSQRYAWRTWIALTRLELSAILRSRSFMFILFGAVIFTGSMSIELKTYLGMKTLPVTYAIIEMLGRGFDLFVFILMVFYAGEMVWRQRDIGMDLIHDSLPISTVTEFFSRVTALFLMLLVLMTALLGTCLTVQIALGYHKFEIIQYLVNFYGIRIMGYLPFGIFALFVHTLVNKKSLGHMLTILGFVAGGQFSNLGYEHYMIRFVRLPRLIYSDMNGYGPTLPAHLGFAMYWIGFAVVLAVITRMIHVRGPESSVRVRIINFRRRLMGPAGVMLVCSALFFTGFSTHVLINTRVYNHFQTREDRYLTQADYERNFRHWRETPQPRVTDVTLETDIFPDERAVESRGRYTLTNKTEHPIPEILVLFPGQIIYEDHLGTDIFSAIDLRELTLDVPCRRKILNENSRIYLFTPDQPLLPGASLDLVFEMRFQQRGFPNGSRSTRVVQNGTFFDSWYMYPAIGYSTNVEIANHRVRKRMDLPPRPDAPPMDDPVARANTYICSDADRINLDITVSTSKNQIALAPGNPAGEWMDGDRRFFRYRTKESIWNFYCVVSGEFEVLRDKWQGVDLAIYYHRDHAENLEIMMTAMKDSLAYCSREYGPFQHDILRIVEFPRYNGFAQSFATLIPYSESIGFIADFDENDPDAVDILYYVTAHEVAHQWWAHEICPAGVEGASVVTETVARYAADMMLKHRYGEERLKRYTTLRIDEYLTGRSAESSEEKPLWKAGINQLYLYYAKGGLAMYTLQAMIGESAVNRALARFIADEARDGPPYPTAEQMVSYLEAETPEHLQYLILDLFKSITLFDLKLTDCNIRGTQQTGFQLELTVDAKKYRADGLGNETEIEMDEPVEIGFQDKSGEWIYRGYHQIQNGTSELTLQLDKKPVRATLDPYLTLLDRKLKDNVIEV